MLPKVYVYVFEANDGREAKERLHLAISEYCKECGLDESRFCLYDENGMLEIQRTEKGKPFFPHCSEIQFSISHSGAFWACAVSDVQVGLDLQECAKKKDESEEAAEARLYKMADRFFHPNEVKFVKQNIFHHFFTVWSAREAYVKYTGQGIDRDFSKFCVIPDEEDLWPGMSGQEVVSWEALDVMFWKTVFREQYVLCVCTKVQREYSVKKM